MSDLKSVLFGGYSQESVVDLLEELRKKEIALENEIESKNKVIAELTDKLLDYRDKEQFISESLIEAREMAKKIVDDAQKRADSLYSIAQETIKEKLKSTEKVMAQLAAVKRDMIHQHHSLKAELMRLIMSYSKAVESADIAQFEKIESEIGLDETLAERLIESLDHTSNKVIVLPNDSGNMEEEPVFIFE